MLIVFVYLMNYRTFLCPIFPGSVVTCPTLSTSGPTKKWRGGNRGGLIRYYQLPLLTEHSDVDVGVGRVTHTIGGGAQVVPAHGQAQLGQRQTGAVTPNLAIGMSMSR